MTLSISTKCLILVSSENTIFFFSLEARTFFLVDLAK